MFVRGPGGAGNQLLQGATFVAFAADFSGTPSPTMAALGAVAGDLVIVQGFNPAFSNGATFSGVGFTVYWRALTAADLGASITNDAAIPSTLAIYRDASSIALRHSGSTAGTTLNFSGFTKSGKHRGLVASLQSTGPATRLVNTPTGFTTRGNNAANAQGFADRLYPANSLYADGTAFNITTNGSSLRAAILELLSA